MILCMMFMWLYVIWFISMSWAIIWWWLLTLLNCLIGSPVILETIMLSIFISLDHCTWWLNDSTNESKMSILYAINCIHCWCSMIHMILCCIVLYCYYCLTIWWFSICWYESCVFHTIVFFIIMDPYSRLWLQDFKKWHLQTEIQVHCQCKRR